jgi:hypothetical protein
VLVLRFEGHTQEALERIEADMLTLAAQRQARRELRGGRALRVETAFFEVSPSGGRSAVKISVFRFHVSNENSPGQAVLAR